MMELLQDTHDDGATAGHMMLELLQDTHDDGATAGHT